MQGLNDLQIPLSVIFLVSVIISLISILVAFDARERGMNKMIAIAWFFAVQIFPPIALIYLVVRRMEKFKKPPAWEKPPEKKQRLCPYCNTQQPDDARICGECGRLL